MAASSSSNLFRVGRSILTGLSNNVLGASRSSSQLLEDFLTQQKRTFIQMRTKLKVVDNSGAKSVMCIQALKGRKGARLRDIIVASVKEAHAGGKVKRGDVVRAAMQRGRCDGSEIKFDDNAAVLINKQGELIGNRVHGPVPHELRKMKQLKILSLAEKVA